MRDKYDGVVAENRYIGIGVTRHLLILQKGAELGKFSIKWHKF